MTAPEVVTHSDLEVVSLQPPSSFRDHKQAADPAIASSTPVLQYDYSRGGQLYVMQTAQESEKKIVGLAPKIFFLVLTAIVVALAIGFGAGTGAGMGIKSANTGKTKQPSVTVTVTVTASASASTSTSINTFTSSLTNITVPTNGALALSCPSVDNTNLRIALGTSTYLFTITCGEDFAGSNQDIMAVISYSLDDCAQACASYNLNNGSAKCVAATFNSELGSSVENNYGTCFLKNGTTSTTQSTTETYAGLVLQA